MALRATPEKKEEKERIRRALQRAALQLAAEHGFSSLGLREVSREAGIAPTSFYRHFADMHELGLTLIKEHVGELVGSLVESLRADTSVAGRAKALVSTTLAAADQAPELARFLVAERVGSSASFRAALREQLAPLVRSLSGTDSLSGERTAAALAAEAAVVLLLDGLARALDRKASQREALREALLAALTRQLEPRAVAKGRA